MAKFIQNGKTIDYTPASSGVTAGELVQVGADFYGVADRAIAATKLGALTIQGAYEFVAGANINLGAKVYAGTSGAVVASEGSGTSGTKVGRALNAVTSGGKVTVLLNA